MKNNQIIQFTKYRFLFFGLSLLLILGGIIGMSVQGGFNLGIDFQAGLSQRVQIADQALSITYDGADDVTLNVVNGNLVVRVSNESGVVPTTLSAAAYPTIGDLAEALNGFADVNATVVGKATAGSNTITAGLSMPLTLSAAPSVIHVKNTDADFITIDMVRSALDSVTGSIQVQIVGSDIDQEFQIRVEAASEGVKEVLEEEVSSLLKEAFGDGSVVVKQSDYVGPKFSNLLTYRSVIMVVVALALIMVYIWVRFQFASAISAIAALTHDILIMLGFIAVLRLEVTTTTIAAVLTIIGYSLNDTIVVFDRIRENTKLMRGKTVERIVNTSITQSLSRTLITSLTTLLAVLPLFIFAKGSIRLFALNLIVGIIVGTYSSIFVASPILLAITNYNLKRKAKHLGKDPAAVLADQINTESGKEEAAVISEIEIPTAQRKLKGKRQKK